MNVIDNHLDCLSITNHLVKVFEDRRKDIEESIAQYESVAQVALDFTDAQHKLANEAIAAAMKDIFDSQPPPEDESKPSKFRPIELTEFLGVCDVFYPICPEIKENIELFEKNFIPAGSYDLLPDDNIQEAVVPATDVNSKGIGSQRSRKRSK